MRSNIDAYYQNLNLCIGRGSHAIVQLYLSKATRELVAVKCINGFTECTSDQGLNEHAVLSQLPVHTNIVEHRETFTDETDILCVLEYLPSTLQHYMNTIAKEKFKLREDEALSFLHDILEGLHHLHTHGVLHADLKPSNILLSPSRQFGCVAKISDFGTAIVFPANSIGGEGLFADRCRSLRGTRRYQPPEVLLDREGPVRIHETDIWAAGCIFFEILCGGSPFIDTRTCFSALRSIHRLISHSHTVSDRERLEKSIAAFHEIIPRSEPVSAADTCTSHPFHSSKRHHEQTFDFLSSLKPTTIDLIQKLLAVDPFMRTSARDALSHQAFAEAYVVRCLPMPLPPSKVRQVCEWVQKNSRLMITPNSNCFSHTPPPSRSLVDYTPPRKLFE